MSNFNDNGASAAGGSKPSWRASHIESLIAAGKLRDAHDAAQALLRGAPDDPGAWFALGLIAAENRNFARALDSLDRGISQRPDEAILHAHRARALAFLLRLDEALIAAERAETLCPEEALTFDTIGVVYSRAGLHTRAAALFAEAARRTPNNASFRYNLAASLQFSGQFAESESEYRKAWSLDRKSYRALAAIPHLRRQSADDNLIAELETAFEAAPNDEPRRLHLGHALAKTYEDLGEDAQAMSWLERAKLLGHARLPAAEARDRAAFEAAMLNAPAAGPGFQSSEPIFIVGLPRSGTTLTDRILSSHPDVFSAGELGNFALILKRAARTPGPFVLEAETLRAGLELDPAELGRRYIESTRPRTGHTPRFVDKMPLNFFYAGLIHRALPKARVICLRRSPMDSCLSNYRQLLATGVSNYDYALSLESMGRYYARFAKLAAHWRATLPASRFTELWYEDLVLDQESETRRLLDFAQLDWDPACLNFHENAAPVATASSVQVRKPLYATSIGRWRRYGDALAPLRAALEAEGISIDARD